MALHDPGKVGVGGRFQLVLGNLLDAIEEALPRGTIEEGVTSVGLNACRKMDRSQFMTRMANRFGAEAVL